MEEQEEKKAVSTFKEKVAVSLETLISLKEVSENTKKAVELLQTADDAEDVVTILSPTLSVGYLMALRATSVDTINTKVKNALAEAIHSIL